MLGRLTRLVPGVLSVCLHFTHSRVVVLLLLLLLLLTLSLMDPERLKGVFKQTKCHCHGGTSTKHWQKATACGSPAAKQQYAAKASQQLYMARISKSKVGSSCVECWFLLLCRAHSMGRVYLHQQPNRVQATSVRGRKES